MDTSGFRCGLSGSFMVDPVVVCTTTDQGLVKGLSYERATLEHRLAMRGDTETRYVPNPALQSMIAAMHRMGMF
jgi:hypothetical protein